MSNHNNRSKTMYSIIAQPHDAYRVGDFLTENLVDPKWTEFRASVAFVKKSGTEFIHESLAAFARVNSVNVSIGLDHGGSSVEGFNHLLNAISPKGRLWAYKNNGSTYHPKVYLFKNRTHADLIVGSGNLTKGGLYENAEMGVRLQLDLAKDENKLFLASLEKTLDIWSTEQPKRCLAVTEDLIVELHASGDLPTETEAIGAIKRAKSQKSAIPGKKPSLFNSSAVPAAPRLVQKPKIANPPLTSSGVIPAITHPAAGVTVPSVPAAAAPATAAPVHANPCSGTTATLLDTVVPILQIRSTLKFGMTLQTTDVGVGQTTVGAQARSPEIFIPVGALDMHPDFWGWISQFVPDATKYNPDLAWRIAHSTWIANKLASTRRVPRPLDKLDWEHVKINLIGHNGLLDVAVWFNPDKVDIRFREANLRSSGKIDDILVVEHAPQGANYHYLMEVIPTTDPRYSATYARLNIKVPGKSLKRYGYF